MNLKPRVLVGFIRQQDTSECFSFQYGMYQTVFVFNTKQRPAFIYQFLQKFAEYDGS